MTSKQQCATCGRELDCTNAARTSNGARTGECGFCAMNSPRERELNFSKELTLRVGPTADRSFRRSVAENTGDVKGAAAEHAGRLAEWPAFVRETFARLYDEDGCKPLPEDKVSSWGMQAANTLERQPTFPALREAASCHRAVAAEVTRDMSEVVAQAMGLHSLPENDDTAQSPQDIEGYKNALREMLAEAGVERPDEHPTMQQADANAAKAAAVRNQAIANLAAAERRGALGRALKAVAENAQASADAVKMMRGLGIGTGKGIDGDEGIPDELVEMVKSNKQLLEILRMAGRLKESAAASGISVLGTGQCDVVGVRPGGDFHRLLPQERARLRSSPVVRLDLVRRINDKEAACWDLRGDEKRDRGDVILAVDRSGSMYGQRIVFARAVACALMVLAVKEGRRVSLVMFDHTTETALVDKPAKLVEGIKLLGLPASGGTDVDRALTDACDALGELREPEVVVISDGEFSLSQHVVDRLKGETRGRMFGVMLGGARMVDDRFDEIWCEIWCVSDRETSDGKALELLTHIKGKKAPKKSK